MKRTLCIILSVLIAIAVPFTASAETVYQIGTWVVESVDGGYMIDSCSSTSESITVPEMIGDIPATAINDEAFMSNTTVHTLNIDASLKDIGEYAFLECTALSKVTLPASLTHIGEGTFSGTSSLTELNFEDTSVSEVPAYSFSYSGLTRIALPETCIAVADNAFLDCVSLKSITLPDSVQSIGESAFAGCDKLSLVCAKGSYAEQYAVDHGYKYSYIVYGTHIAGDADGDGVVTIFDATKVQRVLADFDEEDPDAVRIRGDVDGNGLDIFDATAIQRYLAEMGNPYDIGEPADEYYR